MRIDSSYVHEPNLEREIHFMARNLSGFLIQSWQCLGVFSIQIFKEMFISRLNRDINDGIKTDEEQKLFPTTWDKFPDQLERVRPYGGSRLANHRTIDNGVPVWK